MPITLEKIIILDKAWLFLNGCVIPLQKSKFKRSGQLCMRFGTTKLEEQKNSSCIRQEEEILWFEAPPSP